MASRYSSHNVDRSPSSSKARRPSSSDLVVAKQKNPANIGTMIKKLINGKKPDAKPGSSDRMALVIPPDPIADQLKKAAPSKASNFTALQRKLFLKGGSAERKVLTEVKTNTRTLAMVLRSERELMDRNKEYETEVLELRVLLDEKEREVEKLRNLCFKQREEIKTLKDAILFPDEMNSQLQVMLEKQGSELRQAKQVIPSLQKQVSSLTGQLQCLAEGLAEVKADKYGSRTYSDGRISSPRTPILFQDAANSLEYSSGEPLSTQQGTPDDMFLKDLNPCLTPCFSKMKLKEYGEIFGDDSPSSNISIMNSRPLSPDTIFDSSGGLLSKSSEHQNRPRLGSAAQRIHRSDESKRPIGKAKCKQTFLT